MQRMFCLDSGMFNMAHRASLRRCDVGLTFMLDAVGYDSATATLSDTTEKTKLVHCIVINPFAEGCACHIE